MTEKTLLDEIAIEAMKALVIAKGADGISFSQCDDIAVRAYDIANSMLAEKKHIEKEMAEETMRQIEAMG